MTPSVAGAPQRPAQNGAARRGLDRVAGTSRAVAPAAGLAENDAMRAAAPKARVSSTSIVFDPLLSFDAWRTLGARVGSHSSASSWWLGDWLVFGRMKYGRRYKEAISVTGLDYQTLRNYAVVARRFDASRRRRELTFHHHAELCALPDDDQERWLDLAAQNAWSKRELRRRVRGSRDRAVSALPVHSVMLTLEPERESLWQGAARRAAQDLETWIVSSLDAAAQSAVDRAQ